MLPDEFTRLHQLMACSRRLPVHVRRAGVIEAVDEMLAVREARTAASDLMVRDLRRLIQASPL